MAGIGIPPWPVKQVFTTEMYPVEITEAMVVSGSLQTATLIVVPLDEYDGSITILGGELETMLEEYDHISPEEYNGSISIISGELETVLEGYDHLPPEEYDSTINILSGELNSVLVTVVIDTEAFNVSGSLISGTLT